MKKYIILIALALLVTGCAATTSQKMTGQQVVQKQRPVKIGFVGPLTGDVSSVGVVIKAAVELAVQEINQQGGINGTPLKIVYEDGRCTAKDALTSGSKLINIDRVDYLLTGCSPGTLAIAPIAEANKVVTIAYVSSSPNITYAGDYIFRNYKNDLDAGKAAAEYMHDAGIERAALLWSLNDYSQGLANVFKKEFTRLGGSIAIEESFEQGAKDLRSTITKIKNTDAEAVFLVEFTEGVITYFKQAQELGLDLPVYGADNFEDPKIPATLGKVFNGARYVEVKKSASDGFKTKIQLLTGQDSMSVGVPNAYDAVHILAQAISTVGDDPTRVKDYLYSMPAYNGESGTIKFDKNGDLQTKQFELREIVDGKAVVVG